MFLRSGMVLVCCFWMVCDVEVLVCVWIGVLCLLQKGTYLYLCLKSVCKQCILEELISFLEWGVRIFAVLEF